MYKTITAITLALGLAGLGGIPVLADSPQARGAGEKTLPRKSMPGDQAMTAEQMQAMRQQSMPMMQAGAGQGAGMMMTPMMKQMMQKRDRHWQQVEQRLANIEDLLRQLVKLQEK